MTQLTKEHLDKALTKHFKQVDQRFEKMDRGFDAIEAKVATKDDLAQLAAMVQHGFEEISRKLDLRDQVARHERDIRAIKQALPLSK